MLASVVVGGAISAIASAITQLIAGKSALKVAERNAAAARALEDARNRRVDEAAHRQMRAVLTDVFLYVDAGRRNGLVDAKKWRIGMDRALDRLSAPDVAFAMTDEQARLVYKAAHSCALALQVQDWIQQQWEERIAKEEQKVPITHDERDEYWNRTKGNCDQPYRELKQAFVALGDRVQCRLIMNDQEFELHFPLEEATPQEHKRL